MADNDDLKAKMREALARKQAHDQGVPVDGPVKEKAHGSEVVGGAPEPSRRRGAPRDRRVGADVLREQAHAGVACRRVTGSDRMSECRGPRRAGPVVQWRSARAVRS